MRLGGKVALVTGAASGIGYAVAVLFAREGAMVFASDTVSPETPYPEGVEALTLDIGSEADWETAIDTLIERSGRLDVLVNNAGIIACEPLDELGPSDWLKLTALDQIGMFLGMREAIRVMRRRKSGSIVNISAIWGITAFAGAHSRHAAKGVVGHMSKDAAVTCAADGIRVNTVHPGLIHTPLTESQAPEISAAVIAAIPMKRGGTAIEVAYGCLFLATDEASYITGAELVIDGGYLAR